MSVKSWSSLGGGGGDKEPPIRQNTDDIVKMGYLKKLKTMKRKYFVLRKDSDEASARLEYYDSEKKFRANNRPKRSITLKTCFNINKRNDTRQKWVIALYTQNDCFCLVLESEAELEDWLKNLLTLQLGEDIPDGEPPRPTFEHVWQVVVQKKELGHSKNILGPYHLCLTDKTLSLVKMGPNSEKAEPIEFSLHSIRRCGELESFFYLELGQMAVTGAGNLWMQTEDNNIAQNMHAAILSACKRNSQKDLAPKARHRSSSATEASKPITVNLRWSAAHPEEGSRPVVHSKSQRYGPIHENSTPALNSETVSHSGSGQGCATGGGTVVGGGGVVPMHQRTYSFPLSPLPPSRRASTGNRPANKQASSSSSSTSNNTCHNSVMGVGRERCASMPSRPRTSSEGGHRCPPFARPSSIYNSSYSPQMTDLSPVSPEREGLTDSSLSMEGDGMEFAEGSWHGRDCENRLGHSLTPEEPVILEESNEDCMRWPSGEEERTNNPQRERSLCLPIQNNNMHYRKISPNSTSGFKPSSPSQASLSDMYSPPCGSSPLETSSAYMPMSPGERGMTGVRVGGAHSANHSRGSSLAEEGYVPMAPSIHDDGYVDMDIHGRSNRNLAEHFRDGELSASSSCSITSGTPSTDVRFPEYTLEKVSTYITPSEDDLTPSERPARAYSVGSRPMLNKRTDILNQSECQQRTRAFSVGSRCPRLPPESTLPPSRRALSSSHSSVEPSDDLMEIDFSKNNKRRNRFFKKPSSAERLLVPPNGSVTSSVASSYSTAEGSSYMDMSPRASPKLYDNKEQPASDYVHASSPKTHDLKFGRSPPTSFVASSSPPVIGFSSVLGQVPEGETGFIEPRPVDQVRLFHHGRSPPTASAAPSFASPLRRARSPSEQEEAAYMPMQPVETKSVVAKTSRPRVDSFPVAETSRLSNAPKTSSLPIKTTINNLSHSLKSIKDECSDVNALKRKSSSVEDNNNTKMMMTGTTPMEVPMQHSNEDYVQMAPDGRSIRRVSLDSGCGSSRNEDYMNMTPGNGNGKHQQQQSRNGRKDRTRFNSQPIAIRPTTSGAVPVATYNGVRKLSSGTPPKVPSYLGLSSGSSPSSSPYSSLSRRRSKTEGLARSESRESNGLSTPDTGASTPIFRISLNSPISPNGPAVPSSFDSAAKCPVDATDGSVRISHQQPSSSSNQSDYINYNPSREVSSSYDDYMPMQPGKPPEPVRKISAPPVFDREPVSASAAPVVDDVVANLGGLVLNSAAAAAVPRSDCSTIVESPAEAVVAAATQRQNGLEAACSLPPPSTDRLCSCPPPPTAEKELHYASLDLVKPEDGGGRQGGSGGGPNLRNQSSTSSASTPSPNPQQNTSTATFTYAEIDFSKNIH